MHRADRASAARGQHSGSGARSAAANLPPRPPERPPQLGREEQFSSFSKRAEAGAGSRPGFERLTRGCGQREPRGQGRPEPPGLPAVPGAGAAAWGLLSMSFTEILRIPGETVICTWGGLGRGRPGATRHVPWAGGFPWTRDHTGGTVPGSPRLRARGLGSVLPEAGGGLCGAHFCLLAPASLNKAPVISEPGERRVQEGGA